LSERVLTQRELNRALLARQRLLARSREPLPRVLERMGGLQAQYAPSMYLGLWSRTEDLDRESLTRGLERRSIVQGTLLRATIHLVSRRDWWPFAAAVREVRRRMWLASPMSRGLTEAALRRAAERLREALRDGPLARKEVEALLGTGKARAVGLWIDLVRAPPSGTWERRRADLLADAETWVGPCDAGEEEGRELLARRYLAAFGPATAAEFADWAGLKPAEARPVVERVGTRRFRAEDGAELLDLPRAPLPDPATPAPARFLPTWDATLLVHARRAGILPEEHRTRIFHVKAPQSYPTFLVDGHVRGTWRHDDGRILLDPFERLDTADRRALEEESERLAAFMA
jgi:hypothetical protein